MSEIIKGKTIEEVNSLFDYFHKLCTGEEPEAIDGMKTTKGFKLCQV